ncbi:hypothetical protein GDO86_009307 [Hymenochirus boettgeri]|uniref:Cystatin domain-containing protein n=1 Tax=Hymenochirus boettgeri TaxID=247094 RepID=A0A8T2JKP5_9PIPI|nr:hypothetical protein GDO86_009307 [Hymenochirus boettgeri]
MMSSTRSFLILFLCVRSLVEIVCAPDFHVTNIDPGFPRNVSTNDPQVKRAARVTVYAYNNMSNDSFLFKEMEIKKAMMQVVKGIKYFLLTEIARTVCPKKELYNLDTCEFQQNKPFKQIFTCYSEVWIMAWLQKETVPVLQCQRQK